MPRSWGRPRAEEEPGREREVEATGRGVSKARWLSFAGLALLLAAFWGVVGIPELLFGWFDTRDGGIHRFHLVGNGVGGGLLLAVGYLTLLVRPGRRVATAQQVAVATVAALGVLLGSVFVPHFDSADVGTREVALLTVVFALTALALALYPRREALLRRGQRVSAPLALLAFIGLALFGWYAIAQMQIQVAVDLATDPHSRAPEFHWAGVARTALALPLVAMVASLRAPGWRLVAWTAALGTLLFGWASAVMPDQASSLGVSWGSAAMAGGVLFAVVAEWQAGHATPPGPQHEEAQVRPS